MHQGYIKLFRSLTQSSFYRDSQYVHMWVHILMSVNRSPKRLKIDKSNKFIDLLPGQVLTSRIKLSAQTGIHRSKVDRILKAFEIEHQIEQQTFAKYRVISITKWQSYQEGEPQLEPQPSHNRATTEPQLSTNKKEEKEKKESRGVFHPPTIEEVTAYCQERNRGVNFEKWMNHYTAKNWMIGKTKMKDWKAAVRTWEKDEVPTRTHHEPRQTEDDLRAKGLL